jgi:hypothetical protein
VELLDSSPFNKRPRDHKAKAPEKRILVLKGMERKREYWGTKGARFDNGEDTL